MKKTLNRIFSILCSVLVAVNTMAPTAVLATEFDESEEVVEGTVESSPASEEEEIEEEEVIEEEVIEEEDPVDQTENSETIKTDNDNSENTEKSGQSANSASKAQKVMKKAGSILSGAKFRQSKSRIDVDREPDAEAASEDDEISVKAWFEEGAFDTDAGEIEMTVTNLKKDPDSVKQEWKEALAALKEAQKMEDQAWFTVEFKQNDKVVYPADNTKVHFEVTLATAASKKEKEQWSFWKYGLTSQNSDENDWTNLTEDTLAEENGVQKEIWEIQGDLQTVAVETDNLFMLSLMTGNPDGLSISDDQEVKHESNLNNGFPVTIDIPDVNKENDEFLKLYPDNSYRIKIEFSEIPSVLQLKGYTYTYTLPDWIDLGEFKGQTFQFPVDIDEMSGLKGNYTVSEDGKSLTINMPEEKILDNYSNLKFGFEFRAGYKYSEGANTITTSDGKKYTIIPTYSPAEVTKEIAEVDIAAGLVKYKVNVVASNTDAKDIMIWTIEQG